MLHTHPPYRAFISLLAFFVSALCALAEGPVPEDSLVGSLGKKERLHLISALEVGSSIHTGGWHMHDCGWTEAEPPIEPKVGRDALLFHGRTEKTGKGDFTVCSGLVLDIKAVGMWVHVAEDANVEKVGLQIHDSESESLIHLVPVDWTGWRWVETPLKANALEQAYPQSDKNGSPDMPIEAVHVVWWTDRPGMSKLSVDCVVAKMKVTTPAADKPLKYHVLMNSDLPHRGKLAGVVVLTNPSNRPIDVRAELSLQQDGSLFSEPLPHPDLGTDHAIGARSWTVAEGKTIAENTLTDGLDYTSASTPYRSNHWTQADQYVELDRTRKVTALGWQSGDANWIEKVDVLASTDSDEFSPVPGLQSVDLHKRWGQHRFSDFRPFRAKTIRLHYHCDGEKRNVIRMPAALSVWDGAADEQFDLPRAGTEIQRITLESNVAPGAFSVTDFEFGPGLQTGQYLLASRVHSGDRCELKTRHIYVEPAWLEGLDETSRFGLNSSQSSLAEEHRKLGIGWVRFENFKWPMVSPAPGEYAFDGSVRPWVVDHDEITAEYRSAGLHILPMMFLTPTWASQPSDDISDRMRLAQVPEDYAGYGEFAFQSVARYGSREVQPDKLKTDDKRTGLDRIGYFELGNEPDLNPLRDRDRPPTYGSWAGTMSQWWDMWRHGAEGVKKADPDAVVVSPGFAGMTATRVDQMRTYKYEDGKCPLDFADVLSVHYYSGRTPPETSTRDENNSTGSDTTFVEQLKRLVEWQNRHKPGMPIWMTETGYDSAGPFGTNERIQAARLPRVVALCLANGLDKVFVYRESGSTPSKHAASGVLRNDMSRKPSWYTYAALIRQLEEATPGNRLPHPSSDVWLQTWERNGAKMLMAYCIDGEEELDIELGWATVTDAFGGKRTVDSTKGLVLSEFPVYITRMKNEKALEPLISQAQKREQSRRRQRRADAGRRLYLFNFGNPEEPAATNIGKVRYYETVPADCRYHAEKGYGFVDGPASANDYKHWMSSDVEKYAVKLDEDQVFRFDVEPGDYELRINASPWGGSADLLMGGTGDKPVRLNFRKGKGETVSCRINVTGRTLKIRGTYQHLLRWLVLEQVLDK